MESEKVNANVTEASAKEINKPAKAHMQNQSKNHVLVSKLTFWKMKTIIK